MTDSDLQFALYLIDQIEAALARLRDAVDRLDSLVSKEGK